MDYLHSDLTKVIIGAFYDAYKYEVGLLLSFGHTPKHKRKAWSNHNKPYLSEIKQNADYPDPSDLNDQKNQANQVNQRPIQFGENHD